MADPQGFRPEVYEQPTLRLRWRSSAYRYATHFRFHFVKLG